MSNNKMKVYIFGAGGYGKKILKNIDLNRFEIKAIIDNDLRKKDKIIDGVVIKTIDILKKEEYDFVIVSSEAHNEIKEQLKQNDVPEEKIIDMFYVKDLDKSEWKFKEVLNETSQKIKFLFKDDHDTDLYIETGICKMVELGRSRKFDFIEHTDYIEKALDYVRVSTLELVSNAIYEKAIEGNVAELGVYQGNFSSVINKIFPDKYLYLFDTFEGFTERDVKYDKINEYVTTKDEWFRKGHLNDTSIDIVLSKMKSKDKCILKKGYFPETTLGLENEKYCFVSLDVDLYLPTYEGLKYFYPRLSKGGFIMIHDYNNCTYRGVKEAVDKYCDKNDITLIPLSDFRGSAIIGK